MPLAPPPPPPAVYDPTHLRLLWTTSILVVVLLLQAFWRNDDGEPVKRDSFVGDVIHKGLTVVWAGVCMALLLRYIVDHNPSYLSAYAIAAFGLLPVVLLILLIATIGEWWEKRRKIERTPHYLPFRVYWKWRHRTDITCAVVGVGCAVVAFIALPGILFPSHLPPMWQRPTTNR